MRQFHNTSCLYDHAGQRKYLTAAERERFLDAAAASRDQKVHTLCLVLSHTGCRVSEALALTPAHIQRESAVVSIISLKKRGKLLVREIPIPADIIETLETIHHLTDMSDDEPLWPMGRTTAWRQIKSVMTAAGITLKTAANPKGLRHGFGVRAVQVGVPLNLVQRWLGHADISTTAIYTNALGAEERELAARMW
ncbi:site-specific integrase [Xanthobacter sp. V4C-4]|uniref:tyrosine-type recombinase/integrase n=1 Tax=Xanthobacter cornucopiae TaxID=3119924 RepID=UPI00372CD79D